MPTISELLFHAESGLIHVPAFQRPWVWKKDHVSSLFTSLYRKYPVGAVVFWPNRTTDRKQHDSLIDGRQRLTALYGVIRGHRPPWMSETPAEFDKPLYFNVVDEQFGYPAPKDVRDSRWVNVTDACTDPDFLENIDSSVISCASSGEVSENEVVRRIHRLLIFERQTLTDSSCLRILRLSRPSKCSRS